MAKQQVIRVGDTIKVVNPRFIKRVGYPLIWTDLVDEVEQDPRTEEAWNIIKGIKRPDGTIDPNKSLGRLFKEASYSKIPSDFIRAIARERVAERGFGGRKRALIYYETVERGAGKVLRFDDGIYLPLFHDQFEVLEKKIAKTGDYYPPTSGYNYDEDWYEPGGLDNCKTHVLLRTTLGWIEKIDVELVKARS